MVDWNENLDEALNLIKRAVELRPDDGYILDLAGLGLLPPGLLCDEAVAPMDRALSPPWLAMRWSTTIWATS